MRQIKVFSRKTLQDFLIGRTFIKNTVLISINDKISELLPKDVFSKFETFYITFFDDISSTKFKHYNAITHKQAHELINFILEHKTYNFFIHCNAGISRSPAVALAIICILDYNGNDKTMFKNPSSTVINLCTFPHYPNWFVFDIIIYEYNKRLEKIKKQTDNLP